MTDETRIHEDLEDEEEENTEEPENTEVIYDERLEPMSNLKSAIVKIIIVGGPIVVEEVWRWWRKRRARSA